MKTDISIQASVTDGLEYEISMMGGEVIAARRQGDEGLEEYCKERVKELRAKLRKHKRRYGL